MVPGNLKGFVYDYDTINKFNVWFKFNSDLILKRKILVLCLSNSLNIKVAQSVDIPRATEKCS